MKIAILDDSQNVVLEMADWLPLSERVEITVFSDHVAEPFALVERLLPFDVVCVMRERTPLPREVLQHLPRLRLIASTGSRNVSIDMGAAKELGITVTATGYRSSPTIELTWALILASVRDIFHENNSIRNGGWQKSVGQDLTGKILGVVGLGNIGGQVARIGLAFGMKIIAWNQNMTPEIAEAAGARLVSNDELFRQADIDTIHVSSALAAFCHDQARFREPGERLSNEGGVGVHTVRQGRRGDFLAVVETRGSHDVRGNPKLDAFH